MKVVGEEWPKTFFFFSGMGLVEAEGVPDGGGGPYGTVAASWLFQRLKPRRLLLLTVISCVCCHFSSLSHVRLRQALHIEHRHHSDGIPRYSFSSSHGRVTHHSRSRQVHKAEFYFSSPILMPAVADSHTPSGPELKHRLPMSFENSSHVVYLLREWYTEGSWMYALSCCGTLLIAVVSVLLKRIRRELENVLLRKSSGSEESPCITGDAQVNSAETNKINIRSGNESRDDRRKENEKQYNFLWLPAAVRRFPAAPNAARAIAAFCNYSVDYILMLLAMTFNLGIFLSLLTGIGLGFLLVGHHLPPSPLQNRQPFASASGSNRSRNPRKGSTKSVSASHSRNENIHDVNSTTKTACSLSGSVTMKDGQSGRPREGIMNKDLAPLIGDLLFVNKLNTSDDVKTHVIPDPDDVYCCRYRSVVVHAHPQGDLQQTDGKTLHIDPKIVTHGREWKPLETPVTGIHRASLNGSAEGSSETGSASDCAAARPRPEVSAFRRLEAQILPSVTQKFASRGEQTGSKLQPSAKETASYTRPEKEYKPKCEAYNNSKQDSTVNRSGPMSSRGGKENHCGGQEPCCSIVSGKKTTFLSGTPCARASRISVASPGPLTGSRTGRQGARTSGKGIHAHLHIQETARAAEFQRRSSDCHDILLITEQVEKVYPIDIRREGARQDASVSLQELTSRR